MASKFPPGLVRTPQIDPATGGISLPWLKWQQFMGTNPPVAGIPVFVDAELPVGVINGVNAVFTLANAPNPPLSLQLYKNGQKLDQGTGYTLNGLTITYQPGYIPQPANGGNPADTHQAFYRH